MKTTVVIQANGREYRVPATPLEGTGLEFTLPADVKPGGSYSFHFEYADGDVPLLTDDVISTC